MNHWFVAAAALLFGIGACGWVCLFASTLDRLVAVELLGTVTVLVLLLLAAGFDRTPYYEVALALAVLSLPASLVFVRFLERWL